MEQKIYIVTSTGVSKKTSKPYSILGRLREENGNMNISDKDTIFFEEKLPPFTKVIVRYEILK